MLTVYDALVQQLPQTTNAQTSVRIVYNQAMVRGESPLKYSALLLAVALAAYAQTTTASLSGRVTDPSNAVVTDAEITVTNVDTGVRRAATSNAQGLYVVPQLQPGNYTVAVRREGFRPITRSGVTLNVNQAAQIDFELVVGSVTETVDVKADAPLLEQSEAALGAVIDNAKITNLPLNGRNPFDLVLLTPGTQVYSRGALPGNNIPLANFSTNGGPAMTNDILLDGIPDTTIVQNQFVIVPSVDATQEFKVQSNSIKAEFGRTGGGVVNVSLRSGTNQFHGVLFEFLRNDKFDANNWFNNRAGQKKPPFRFNQFGGTLGGPIVRDKTFFFVNYEGLRRIQGRTTVFTVPGAEMRAGDFSRLQDDAGNPVMIYNPFTTRLSPNGTTRVRDPFPGNVIPRSVMDPVALRMLEYWAPPNDTGNVRTGANNFISTAGERYTVNQFNTRIDHNIGTKHFLFGRISWDENFVAPPNVFGNIANPSSGPQLFTQRNVGVHDTWTVTPNTIASFRAGFSRLRDSAEAYGKDFDITSLGLPASYARQQAARQFPQINVTGMTIANLGFGSSALGPVDNTEINNLQNAYTGQSDLTLVRGSHVVKFGADGRVYRVHGTRPQNGAGTFSFTPGFTQGPDPTRAGPTSGNAFASFLLGTPASGNISTQPTQDFQQYYGGFYAQDDWKISPAVTLNLGLRYEFESYRTDRFDRLTFLDLNSPSQIQASTLGRPLTGGLAFAGVGGNPRSQAATSVNNWGPRFGFAWTFRRNIVLRGGYGIFYSPRVWRGIGFGQQGFSSTTPMLSSIDGFTPVNLLSNPFSDGFVPITGNSLGIMTNVGQAISSLDHNQTSPYVQQWNFGTQTTLPGQLLVEVAYAGSKGSRLMQNLGFNQIADEYLALGNELLRQVPNPFLGQIPANTTLGRATVSLGQTLRPYPQFLDVEAIRSTSGSSSYHSMQLRVERRFSSGFTVLMAYTVSKLIDDGMPGGETAYFGENPSHQNYNNRRLERSVASQSVPQRFVASYVYELPFGGGSNTLLRRAARGWQLNGITTLQSGIPLSLRTASNPTLGAVGSGALRPDNNGKSAKLSGPTVDRLDRYFDTSVFSQPAPFRFGNTARTLPDVRAPGIVNFDFSAIKNTRFREQFNLQFRAEMFNALNNTNFGLPATTFGAPGFGSINSASAARIIQFGLKLYY